MGDLNRYSRYWFDFPGWISLSPAISRASRLHALPGAQVSGVEEEEDIKNARYV
jgi:hypothetical protein